MCKAQCTDERNKTVFKEPLMAGKLLKKNNEDQKLKLKKKLKNKKKIING